MPAITNIGVRPTFGDRDAHDRSRRTCSGSSGDLYGASMRVGFVQRLRDERAFDGVDALRAQIEADSAAARVALRAHVAVGSAELMALESFRSRCPCLQTRSAAAASRRVGHGALSGAARRPGTGRCERLERVVADRLRQPAPGACRSGDHRASTERVDDDRRSGVGRPACRDGGRCACRKPLVLAGPRR